MFPKFTSGDWRSIVLADSGSDRDNYLWIILLKRKRYLKIYLIQEFLLHKFTVHNNKSSQTLMAVRLDYQPIRRVENSSSGSMDKTNQSDFVTTVGLGIKKNLTGCFGWTLKIIIQIIHGFYQFKSHTNGILNKSFQATIFFSMNVQCS